jgi:predicted dinucleotide-binding enzyme
MFRVPVYTPARRDVLRLGLLAAALPHQGFAAAAPLKVATIGAGRMGSALGALFVKAGHPVMFSSRHPEELKRLADGLGPLARAGTVADAVAFGDVVILLVPYSAMPDLAKDFGKQIAGKTLVMDVSNPIAARDGDVGATARAEGAGVFLAKLMPGARIVRAFNAIGAGNLATAANRSGERTGVPMAGDDAGALTAASDLVREIGFDPVVIGSLAMGRHLIPGTPIGGEHTAAELRKIAATLK